MQIDDRPYSDIRIIAAARLMLSRVAHVMGVPVPSAYLSLEVPNAAADGVRILINPKWLREQMAWVCDVIDCHVALLYGILAHELAHLVHDDANAPPHAKHFIELRADRDAGVAVARLGVDPSVFAEVIGELASHHSGGPYGYPSRYERIEAIRLGYDGVALGLLQWQYQLGRLAALGTYGIAP
jgi:hypothetical protein